MWDILARAGCFAAIILLGILLRRAGFFKREDFHILSRIVINITLPAAIITNFSGRSLEYTLLLIALAGFLFGIFLMSAAYLLNRHRNASDRAFAVLNSSGVNVSNFVLPFVQGFLGPAGVMAVSLFDVGNAVICLGGAYGVADMIDNKKNRFSLKPILRSLACSVPLVTYIIMCLFSAFRISLPGPVVDLAGIIGSANPFLSMLMLGVGFRFSTNRIPEVLRILLPRYLIGIVFAVLCWLFLPVPALYRQALVIPFLGPVSSAVPAYTARMKGDYELSSAINSFSILVSILLIVAVLLSMA